MVDFCREHPFCVLSHKYEVDPTPLHLRLIRTMVVFLPLLLRKSHASGVCRNDRACRTNNYVTLNLIVPLFSDYLGTALTMKT